MTTTTIKQRRPPQADRRGGQAVADVIDSSLRCALKLVSFCSISVLILAAVSVASVKIVDVGADGDEAEALRRLAVLAGVIGNGGGGRQFPQAGEEDDEGADPPCSVTAFQPSHCGEKLSVAAVKAEHAGFDLFLPGRLAFQVLVAEGLHAGQKFVGGLPLACHSA